jgi:hypothetical protein
MELVPARVNLPALAAGVLRDLADHPQLRGRHALLMLEGRPAGEDAALCVEAEETLCATMLANLFKNALEASPEGGVVEVDLRDAGGAVRIDVRNEGEVPASVRQRFSKNTSPRARLTAPDWGRIPPGASPSSTAAAFLWMSASRGAPR